ncbi:transcription factor IIA subunit alpha [Entophlyctis luteolus]|nr:transcription factor IIA subunit alpha [Entophlyctis luteolus]
MRPYFAAVGLPDQILTDIEKARCHLPPPAFPSCSWSQRLLATACADFSGGSASNASGGNRRSGAAQQQQQQAQLFLLQPPAAGQIPQPLLQQQQLSAQLYQSQLQLQQQQQIQQGSYPVGNNELLPSYPQQSTYGQGYSGQFGVFGGGSAGGSMSSSGQSDFPFGTLQNTLPPPQQRLPLPQTRPGYPSTYGYQLPQNDGVSGPDDALPDGVDFDAAPTRAEIDALILNGVGSALARRAMDRESGSAASSRKSLRRNPDTDELLAGTEVVDRDEKRRILDDAFMKRAKGTSSRKIAQIDGADDEDEDDEDEDDDNNRLGSDLDSNDDDENSDGEMSNLILCQYEKVNRTKNKWKCVFKDGIVHVNGKDYLFQKGNADFEW